MSKFTPGPWFADEDGCVWRRDPAELYENGGHVAGDKFLAKTFEGWYGENETGYPHIANALLIAQAPAMFDFIETLENDDGAIPDWLWEKRNEILAKATGKEK